MEKDEAKKAELVKKQVRVRLCGISMVYMLVRGGVPICLTTDLTGRACGSLPALWCAHHHSAMCG